MSIRKNIFCIGFNKTGTTSLGRFLDMSGFEVARQKEGELLLNCYLKRSFNEIIDYCNKSPADVFQDVPFSLPNTFQHLDNAFPDSKFILTIRNSSEIWYKSILHFHSHFYNLGKIPSYKSLKESSYIYEGWSWDLMSDVFFNGNKKVLYHKREMINVYEDHIKNVLSYFKNKPEKLIVINLAYKEDLERLCQFIGIDQKLENFPRITSSDILQKKLDYPFLK